LDAWLDFACYDASFANRSHLQSNQIMARSQHIHWVTPVIMTSAFFAAVMLALGHHLFYASLAGSEAPTGAYSIVGADIPRQQLKTGVGTALAFLVKSFLSTTVSVASIQAFWRAACTSRKGPTIASLDSTYSLLTNFLGLFDRSVWVGFPFPRFLAFIAWFVALLDFRIVVLR
jgi:hypothetical protein